VNDRLDLALALDADGGHLGGQSFAVADARSLLGRSALVGCSVHGRDDAGRAGASGGTGASSGPVDFVIVGAIFPTPTHPAGQAKGVGLVAEVRGALAGMPIVAIGGIDPSRVPEVIAAGAHGVAVVRAAWDASDSGAAVSALLDALGPTPNVPAEARL
jgi:thiamine-phosphate pyrophosphorylase